MSDYWTFFFKNCKYHTLKAIVSSTNVSKPKLQLLSSSLLQMLRRLIVDTLTILLADSFPNFAAGCSKSVVETSIS